ncbi:tetratricopeptide repeat protein [Candidatus Palauibacter sp.]|uniref:tetratricopeptide repeat protein n=1 Tax=Candidatus Palauibacter sp. TaxID=3101350 RepID=UPI003B5A5211
MNRTVRAIAGVLIALALAGCEDPVDRSIVRGDRYLAVGDTDMAIAEYLLAQRVRGDTDDLLLRLGHAYAARGDVDEVIAVYQTLTDRDPGLRHQAAASLAGLAWAARERGAGENMSRALQPLLGWGLGYLPADLQRSLAARYADEGDDARALSLRLALLAEEGDPDPAVLYEIGLAYEQLGACTRALPFLRKFLETAEDSDPNRDAAGFQYGECLFESADEDRAEGRPGAALEKLDEMVELGVPRPRMVDAHFQRGELRLALGELDEALASYAMVLELNPTRTHALVRRAEERIRQIRFGFE